MMSNERKDWISDFTEEQRKNYELCMKYPILIPTNRWTGKTWDDYAYESTELDAMPTGWRIAFGEQWAAEIQDVINKLPEDKRESIRIMDVKEKFGFLHTYFSYYTKELNDVIRKYERLSERTCIKCGAPATKISQGWISPYCNACSAEIPYKMVDINEWLEDSAGE